MIRLIVTFTNVRQVIKADAILRQNKIIAKIIPVPEHISSECGMCIETNNEQTIQVGNLLAGLPHQFNLVD
jgi:hypothetical protein